MMKTGYLLQYSINRLKCLMTIDFNSNEKKIVV